MAITSDMIKQLRERTGAGMMDCKKALTESGGDMEAAIDWLRKKGLAAASKKAGRTASEGLIGVGHKNGVGAMVEVNSETDFVARNEEFQTFVRTLADLATKKGVDDVEALLAADYPGAKHSVADEVTAKVARIGENISIRRMAKYEAKHIATYMHNAVADNLGKIGVLLALESSEDIKTLETLGKQLAMHIAASAPLAIDEAGVDKTLVAREQQLYRDQAIQSGKDAAIADKMVVGRMKKFMQEVVLLQQVFVMNGETKIADLLAGAGKGAQVTGFTRFQLGEGIEKEEKDFAAEVGEQLDAAS